MSKTKCFTCRKTINREHTQKFDYAPDGKLRAYHLKCRRPHKVCAHGVIGSMVEWVPRYIEKEPCEVCSNPVQYNSKPSIFGGLREKLARVLSRTLSLK